MMFTKRKRSESHVLHYDDDEHQRKYMRNSPDEAEWASLYETSWVTGCSPHNQQELINEWFAGSVVVWLPWAYHLCLELKTCAEDWFDVHDGAERVRLWISHHNKACVPAKVFEMIKGDLSWTDLLDDTDVEDDAVVAEFFAKAWVILRRKIYNRCVRRKRCITYGDTIAELRELNDAYMVDDNTIRAVLESDSDVRQTLERLALESFDLWMTAFAAHWFQSMVDITRKHQKERLPFSLRSNATLLDALVYRWLCQCHDTLSSLIIGGNAIPHAHKIIPDKLIEMIISMVMPSQVDAERVCEHFILLKEYM